MVSSIYLLHLLNNVHISVIASATRSSDIFFTTFSTVISTTSLRSVSTSIAPATLSSLASVSTPSKYLFVMDIVLLTRFPSTFARSELNLSTISSQLITPSLSKGISCNTKYLTASTPKKSTKVSAYITFPFDLLILPSPCKSQGCPNTCFGSGKSSAIRKIGQ